MLVPKTAVDENNFLAGAEYKVGPTWKLFCVKSVAISETVNQLPNGNFRFHSFATNPAHILATPCCGQLIGHLLAFAELGFEPVVGLTLGILIRSADLSFQPYPCGHFRRNILGTLITCRTFSS